MGDLKDIVAKIINLTTTFETDYPELYQFLDEDPMTIPSVENPRMDEEVMQKYLDDLEQILKQYAKTHKAK